MNLHGYLIKNQVIKAIRDFWEEREYVEVVTPVFQTGLPTEAQIFSFETTWNPPSGPQKLYMAIYPETSMKKVLAAGLSNCFTIGKCFRNLEGSSYRHNPEFMMLEWYKQDGSWTDIMSQTQDLVRFVKSAVDTFNGRPYVREVTYQGETMSLEGNWPRLSLVDLFQEHAKIAMSDVMTDEAMVTIAQEKGYTTDGASWDSLFDQIFLNEVEAHLPTGIFFLVDFPARTSPLCKPQPHRPYLAERFELYMAGMEIGNGMSEHLDAKAVAASFETTRQQRTAAGKTTPPVDQEFLEAIATLEAKGKNWAGIGLGIERLAMIMANAADISHVEPFAIKSPEN